MVTAPAATTLTCLPMGLLSWNFRVVNEENTTIAEVDFAGFYTRPTLIIDGSHYPIVRSGMSAARWTLTRARASDGPAPALTAECPFKVLKTRFEIKASGRHYVVEQKVKTHFEIRAHDSVVGTIKPARAFTRRTLIICEPGVPVLLQLFCFAMIKQRDHNPSS